MIFIVENEVAPLHTYSDLRKREKLGILSVVTLSSINYIIIKAVVTYRTLQ